MTVSRAYFETTMFSFYHEERMSEEYQRRRTEARAVFARIRDGGLEPYTSDYAIEELGRTTNEDKRVKMLRLLEDYHFIVYPREKAVDDLAALYIAEGAVPASEPLDARHIALTSFHKLDFIVSFNFEHIVRPWTIERVRRVNYREGYGPIGIYKPTEVLEL